MRAAMKSLKMQALGISVRSQKEAIAASAERQSVEDELKGVTAQLQVGGCHRVCIGVRLVHCNCNVHHVHYVIVTYMAVVSDLRILTCLVQ